MLQIKNRPGCIRTEDMRRHFEQGIRQTPILNDRFSLAPMVINGVFSHYMDPDTDTAWIGFALGMRAAEKLQRARAPATEKGE